MGYGLEIGAGIAQGLEKATGNLMNIMVKRKELERQQKQDGIDFQVKKLQLQKLEDDLDPDKIKSANDALAAENKFKQSKYDMANKMLEEALKKGKDDLKNIQTVGDTIRNIVGSSEFPFGKAKYTDTQVRSEAKRIAKAKMGKDPYMTRTEPTNQEVLDAMPAARDFLNKATTRGSAGSDEGLSYDSLIDEGQSSEEALESMFNELISQGKTQDEADQILRKIAQEKGIF